MINKILSKNGIGLGNNSNTEKIFRFNPTRDKLNAINPNRKSKKPISVLKSLFIFFQIQLLKTK